MSRSKNFRILAELSARSLHFSLKIGSGMYLDLTDWSEILGGELYYHENQYPEWALLIFGIYSLFSLIFRLIMRLCFKTLPFAYYQCFFLVNQIFDSPFCDE